MLAGSQLLCFGEYILYKGANAYNINSVDTIEIFYNIRIDIEKLEYASYLEFIDVKSQYEQASGYVSLGLECKINFDLKVEQID